MLNINLLFLIHSLVIIFIVFAAAVVEATSRKIINMNSKIKSTLSPHIIDDPNETQNVVLKSSRLKDHSNTARSSV